MIERYILKRGPITWDFVPRDYYVIELQSYLSVNRVVNRPAPSAIICITPELIKSRLYPLTFSSARNMAVCTSDYDYALFDAWRRIPITPEHQTLYIHRNQENLRAILRDVNRYGRTAGYSYYNRYLGIWENITEVIVDGQCWVRRPSRT